jgi:hypothetical protein
MSIAHRIGCAVVILILLGNTTSRGQAAKGKPLELEDIGTLIRLGIDADTIVSRIESNGVGFAPNEAILERLKEAGASDGVLSAIKKAGGRKPAPAAAITFEQVLKLLELNIGEEAILKRLDKSPTVFTLDAKQIRQLKDAGASDSLIAALQKQRPATPAAEISDLAIILDCSASMSEETPEGKTKMQAAKSVVADLIAKIPESLHVSFVIYGYDKALECKAVKVARPLGPLDRAAKEELATLIAGLEPAGHTPIAKALEVAGKELESITGKGGIVLITDGVETCHGKPDEVAAALAENPKLTFGVNVIGFGLKPEEVKSVAAIAKAGRGKYYDAQSADDLAKVVASLEKTIEEVAKPAPKRKGGTRRAVIVLKPRIKLPDVTRIVLVKGNASYYTVDSYRETEVTGYDQELRLPSDDEYELWWVPKEKEAVPVKMIDKLSIKERVIREIRPEDYLGIVRVLGEGQPKPKAIHISRPDAGAGTTGSYLVQSASKYGADMVVPEGTYSVWVLPAAGGDAIPLEKKLKVNAGELVELE